MMRAHRSAPVAGGTLQLKSSTAIEIPLTGRPRPPAILCPMRHAAKFLAAGAFALAVATVPGRPIETVYAQAPQQPAAPAPADQAAQQPTFRVSVDLVTTDLIVRDARDQFVADLKPEEIQVYEDGILQDVASLVVTQGGRVFNVMSPPPPPVPEGIILPQRRPTSDVSGRIFLLFIDDLHLDFRSTPRTRELIQKMLR